MLRLIDVDKMYDDLALLVKNSTNPDYQAGLMTAMQYLYEKHPVKSKKPAYTSLDEIVSDYENHQLRTVKTRHVSCDEVVYSPSRNILGCVKMSYGNIHEVNPDVLSQELEWVDHESDWRSTGYKMPCFNDWKAYWRKKGVFSF